MFNKKISLSIISILVIGVILGSYYYFNKIQPYNNCISGATKAMNLSEYDKAITLYQQALKYKNDPNINTKIELAKILKTSKDNYDSSIKQINYKKYLEAIELLKKVDKQDDKRYKDSQSKIEECKKQYIAQNIQNAKTSAKNNDYNGAIIFLNTILKLDSTNAEAISLNGEYTAEIKKQQEEKTRIGDEKQDKVAGNAQITKEQAIQMVKQLLPRHSIYEYSRDETFSGEEFYVIHVYEIVNDGSGFSHTATSGWIAVQKSNGKMYNDVLDARHLKPLN